MSRNDHPAGSGLLNDWSSWLALGKAPGLGPRRFFKLLEAYGSPESVLKGEPREIARLLQVPVAVAAGIVGSVPGPREDRECRAIADAGCRLVTLSSGEYPLLLKAIHDPPPFLYAKGRRLDHLGGVGPDGRRAPWIAIVGSRKATPYGRSMARRIAHDLCLLGCVVVSGMAAGVDSYAHKGALDAGGHTVAVLGTGVDVAYPRENARVLDEIRTAGAVVSEYGMGEGPAPWHFPMRNRIISGMCECTVVVEAGDSSGALITADLALEQGRDVMAVPGHAGSAMSRGTNRLIKTGAALVESAEDVLEALGIDATAAPASSPARAGVGRVVDGNEQAVLSLLDNGPSNIDMICEGTSLPPSAVIPLLTNLELRGLVERMNGAVYCRRR